MKSTSDSSLGGWEHHRHGACLHLGRVVVFRRISMAFISLQECKKVVLQIALCVDIGQIVLTFVRAIQKSHYDQRVTCDYSTNYS